MQEYSTLSSRASVTQSQKPNSPKPNITMIIMAKIFTTLATSLSIALMLTGCSQSAEEVAASPTVKVAPLTFNAENATNAMQRVAELIKDYTPRDAGTPEGEKAALWLKNQMVASGVDAKLDRFEDETPRGSKSFVNVIGTLPGKSDQWIILLSHFDTKTGIDRKFEGANDSGSSTGLLLELAALIKNAGDRRYNYLFGFMDGEECALAYSDRDGFHGSKYFAKQLKKRGTDIKAVILTDMIGDRDLMISVPRNSSKELKLLALKAATAAGHRKKISINNNNILDDHQAFLDLKYPAINLIDFEFGNKPGDNSYWHTMEDSMDKISFESLLITGQIVVEMINMLKQQDHN